jgi:hypothetical protein
MAASNSAQIYRAQFLFEGTPDYSSKVPCQATNFLAGLGASATGASDFCCCRSGRPGSATQSVTYSLPLSGPTTTTSCAMQRTRPLVYCGSISRICFPCRCFHSPPPGWPSAACRLNELPLAVFFLVNVTYICLIWEFIDRSPDDEVSSTGPTSCAFGQSRLYVSLQRPRLWH